MHASVVLILLKVLIGLLIFTGMACSIPVHIFVYMEAVGHAPTQLNVLNFNNLCCKTHHSCIRMCLNLNKCLRERFIQDLLHRDAPISSPFYFICTNIRF